LAAIEEAIMPSNPVVEEADVLVRIKVKDPDDRPVMGLKPENFALFVDGQPLPFNDQDWKSPQEATPPPSYIIALIDMSGSMRNSDKRGDRKIEGAIKAMREFRETLTLQFRNVPTANIPQIALVPFGEGSEKCAGFPVTLQTLDNFFPINDFKIENALNYLEDLSPDLCASTNLYEPLIRAVRFLGDTNSSKFYPDPDSGIAAPRLAIILLSDGFHNQASEAEDFAVLTEQLRLNPAVAVHTLGYGLTPEELGQAYQLGRPAQRGDLMGCTIDQATNQVDRSAALDQSKVCEEEFVDGQRLAEIANLTSGIHAFSGNAQDIANRLQLFLNSLLGEYEIRYRQPGAERGSKHQVFVEVSDTNSADQTEVHGYTIQVFGRRVPGSLRLQIFSLTVTAMIILGGIPFSIWAGKIKTEA
jgi:hypothetical protein